MFGKSRDPLRELAKDTQRGFKQQASEIDALRRQNQVLANHIANQQSKSAAAVTMDELKRGEEHYSQVVMLAGYAGFFTLWTQTRSDMSLWMFASTGALISLSLFAFVMFELYKAWSMGRFFQKHPHANVHQLNAHVAHVNKHWHIVFALSAGTGVLAGVSLLFWFVYTTIGAAAHLGSAA